MLSSLSALQRGGVYIFFGGVVSAVGRGIKPGVLVDSADWNDVDSLVQAMADNEVLAHTSAVLYAFGLMFVITGLNSIRHFVTDQGLVGRHGSRRNAFGNALHLRRWPARRA